MLVNTKYRQDKRAQKKILKNSHWRKFKSFFIYKQQKKITTSKGFTLYFLLKCWKLFFPNKAPRKKNSSSKFTELVYMFQNYIIKMVFVKWKHKPI